MPPWRWMSLIMAACCLAAGWAFATADAPYSRLEPVATVLFTTTGVCVGIGSTFIWRRLFLTGIAVGMLTYAFRAWEISIVGNGADLQARLIGVANYSTLFVLTLGLGLAFVRWEAQSHVVRDRSN